jgi:hypothetical protein
MKKGGEVMCKGKPKVFEIMFRGKGGRKKQVANGRGHKNKIIDNIKQNGGTIVNISRITDPKRLKELRA